MEYRVRKRHIAAVGGGGARPVGEMLSDALLRRFHLRAGFTATSPRTLELTRNFLTDFMEKLLDAVATLMAHHNRRSIRLTDVLRACRHYGIRLYGYDDMCVIEGPWGIEELHVTEMVELNTTFSRDRGGEEPDQEPTEFYRKTDFVKNQEAWDADGEDELEDSDDSEWSWFSDSDADSDFEEDEPFISQDNRAVDNTPRWRKSTDERAVFLQALSAAQAMVDDQLLSREMTDDDTPLGQGYFSDCDCSRDPTQHLEWNRVAEQEDAKWITNGHATEYHGSDTDAMSDDDLARDPTSREFEDPGDYVVSRQIFMEIFYSVIDNAAQLSIPISAVALSAIHNVCEQYLHAALTSGSLRAQVVSILMEEQLEATLNERAKVEEERQKVKDVEVAMLEMQSAFLVKEREMQRRIKELEDKLRDRGENSAEDVVMETTPAKSPGKRKATVKDDSNFTKQKGPTSGSIVGSLRTRLQEYSRRKKAKINPV